MKKKSLKITLMLKELNILINHIHLATMKLYKCNLIRLVSQMEGISDTWHRPHRTHSADSHKHAHRQRPESAH